MKSICKNSSQLRKKILLLSVLKKIKLKKTKDQIYLKIFKLKIEMKLEINWKKILVVIQN